MRYIPPDIKAKIEKLNQTIYEDADPKADIVLRRAQVGLTQTNLFNMHTIRKGTGLEDLAIDLKREDVNKPPNKIYNIYIKDGICKVATKNMPAKANEKWVDVYTVGPATDCEIAFDGRWHRDSQYHWQLVTQGEPWLFYVRSGRLYTRHWDKDPYVLAEGVSKIAAIRGWKNVYLWNHDQGIIVAYIKSGKVYYRNYCQQPPDQPALWETETEVVQLPSPAQNIALFRTNDYRVGFLCESNGQIYWALTERNWATMAIEPHFVSAGITDVTVDVIPIGLTDLYTKDSNITSTITDVEVNFCPTQEPKVVGATTDEESTITIEFDMPLMEGEGQEKAFIVIDDYSNEFEVLSTELGETPYYLVLNTESLMGAVSVLNISFRPIQDQIQVGRLRTRMTPCCIKYIYDFDVQAELKPPEGYTDNNISVGITDMLIDYMKVDRVGVSTKTHSVSITVADVSVALIHIDDINP